MEGFGIKKEKVEEIRKMIEKEIERFNKKELDDEKIDILRRTILRNMENLTSDLIEKILDSGIFNPSQKSGFDHNFALIEKGLRKLKEAKEKQKESNA
jgi:glutamyl-tRNA reductase